MAQNHGDKIPTELDHVDYVVGPDNYRQLENMLFSGRGRRGPSPDRAERLRELRRHHGQAGFRGNLQYHHHARLQ